MSGQPSLLASRIVMPRLFEVDRKVQPSGLHLQIAAAQVVPQPHRCSLVRFRRAIRFVDAIQRAVKIASLRPLHIIRHHKIKLAIAIVINPSRAGRKFVRPPNPAGSCNVSKSSIAVIMKKSALPDRSNKDVVKSVVVIIANRDAETKKRNRQPSLAGYVSKTYRRDYCDKASE